MNHAVIASIALAVQFSQASVAAPPPASSMPGYVYDVPFFPGSTYDDAIPTPDAVIGARVGEQPASHAQIEAVIKSLSTAGKRCRLFEYGRTHEGRALYYLVISAQRHIDRLDAIRADLQRLADPRGVTSAETDRLAESTPAVAWMAYVIHGNEMSGSDAALALAHHLIASRDAEVSQMLDELVVIIDPLMNPDGRDRCIGAIREARGAQPGVDDQTLIHTQFWPSGRGNHYLFDLNRDWIFCTQPESRGRVRAVRQWHPQYFMESHEMGSESTFLFMPPREPINLHIAQEIHKWQREFGNDQAAAFDQRGWRYYTGEWNEEWYPGYSGSWAALGGAIDNLYEQASIDADAIRRQEGTLETYRESVHHQLVSSWANLQTLQRNRRSIMRDYAIQRRRNVAADGPYARRLFAMLPDAQESRVAAMRDLCDAQAFELRVARNPFRASGRDRLGQVVTNREFPAGTLLLSAAQPEAPLIAAMFEFDPRMRPDFLREERRELLRRGQSRLYDVTGWCIPMLLDIETFELSAELPRDAALHGMAATMPVTATAAAPATSPAAIVAHAVDGSDDRSVAFAGRLMERGIRVRVAEKRFELGGVRMPRGSVVVLSQDNQPRAASLSESVDIAARELGIIARPLVTGMGQGDLPDLGGGYFLLQEQPRIAVVGREPFSGYSYGETWHLVDHVLGLRASYLNGTAFTRADLRRYNVIVLPDGGSAAWVKSASENLKTWVRAGGTLIAIGRTAGALCDATSGLSSVRLLPDTLNKLDEHRLSIIREWEALTAGVDESSVWSHCPPSGVSYPWSGESVEKVSDDEAKRRDAWRALFMPQGAILAGRTDDRHWLTAGCGDYVPVMYDGDSPLIPMGGAEAPVRLGAFTPSASSAVALSSASTAAASQPATRESGKGGGPFVPPGHDLRLRMSGLLWPEAADRLAHTAYVTRERIGEGQIILFAASPTFRAATAGTTRLLANALVYGPGMGAGAVLRLD